MRYFIDYKFIDKSDINKEKLYIVKRFKDYYRIEALNKFENSDIIFNSLEEISKKNNIFIMQELNKKELDSYNSLNVKKFMLDKKGYEINNEIKLINYTTFLNMNYNEINEEKSFLIKLVYKNDKLTIKKLNKDFTNEDRNRLIESFVGSDIYFYTEDKNILDKYNNELTILTEKDIDSFKIIKHKIFTIDSIPQYKIYDFTRPTIRLFYNLCDKSIPMYLNELDEKYSINLNNNIEYDKKVYMIKDFDIKNVMYDNAILPLLKYINVYELEKGFYKKITIEDYMKVQDILKYIKKPSNDVNHKW